MGRPRMIAPSVGPLPLTLTAITALLVVAFVLSVLPGARSSSGFVPLLDGWLQGAAYVGCALVALAVPWRREDDRGTWLLLGVAMALRSAAFVLFIGYVRHLDPVPYPSASDACWLTGAVLLLLVLGLRVRAQVPTMSALLALDALAALLMTSGVALAFVYDVLVDLNPPGTPPSAVATNLAYPLLDVAMLVLVVGLITAVDARPRTADVVLIIGVVGAAVGDFVFVYQVSAGSYRPGTWVAGLALLTTLVMALSGAVHGGDRAPRERDGFAPAGFVTALVIGFCAIAMIVYASFVPVPLTSLLLEAFALLLVILRGVTTLLGDRSQADVVLRAKDDELLRFQALVRASNDFIAIAAMDGSVIYVNPAGRELVGLDPEVDVTRTTITDYLTEEGQRLSLEIEQPAVVAEGRWEGESTLRDHRGGPPIPVAISSFLMFHPESGEPFALATVQRDISERLAAQQALVSLASERQVLLSRLVQAEEDERARIAADVHDDSVQALAAVDLRLGLLRRQLAEAGSDQVETVDRTLEAVAGATARLRHLLFDLESPAQHDTLASALASASEFVFEDTGVGWEITGDTGVDLPPATRVTAYRILKEVMTNARRHARASRVEIDLARAHGGVLVTVSDDGVGTPASAVRHRPGHRGLASIRDRATIAGGWLRVESPPGAGTRVCLWLPDESPDALEDQDGG